MNFEIQPGTLIKLERVPSGQEHLDMIEVFGDLNRRVSDTKLNGCGEDLQVLGISLSIIYQVATCHQRCLGGPHIYESLLARTYNLACSAYYSIGRGLYDEGLNLIRSLGEIANLIGLFANDRNALSSWLHSDDKERRTNFRPFQVRKGLEELKGGAFLYASEDWYSKFCEDYTHVHPGTKPNVHNEQGQGHAGGHVQDDGLKSSINELTGVCTYIALFASRYGGLIDLFGELKKAMEVWEDS